MLSQEIGELLRSLHLTVATAESATGGRVADQLTNVSGSSDYFIGAVVAYDNDIKRRLLAVPQETLERTGAVSEETAIAMAQGVRKLLGVDVGVSTTGIAGPTGARPNKPVGLVYVAVASSKGVLCRRHIFSGSREENKEAFTRAALELLKEELSRWQSEDS